MLEGLRWKHELKKVHLLTTDLNGEEYGVVAGLRAVAPPYLCDYQSLYYLPVGDVWEVADGFAQGIREALSPQSMPGRLAAAQPQFYKEYHYVVTLNPTGSVLFESLSAIRLQRPAAIARAALDWAFDRMRPGATVVIIAPPLTVFLAAWSVCPGIDHESRVLFPLDGFEITQDHQGGVRLGRTLRFGQGAGGAGV